jgi:hypothetical protein
MPISWSALARATTRPVSRDDEVPIVETVDFFPPIVDDPYSTAPSGRQFHVRRLATGGQVLFALNVRASAQELPRTSSWPLPRRRQGVREAG